MEALSPEGEKIVEQLAHRYGVSTQAVTTLLRALVSGNGTMAQFSHPEFGGMGQWSQGGMTMVGDMFNHSLKAKVDGLCSELSALLPSDQLWTARPAGASGGIVSLFVPATGRTQYGWWGADLGSPASTGSQNDIRYAFFPGSSRLAIGIGDRVVIYDTEDHQISGVSQQQSGDASLTFMSQNGLVRVADLRVASPVAGDPPPSNPPPVETPASATAPTPVPPGQESGPTRSKPANQEDDIFSKLERLADLHKKGIVSDQEFAAKKADLLGRL